MEFKYKNLSIDFVKPIENIVDLKITKELNKHSKVYIRGIIPEEETEEYANTATINDKIKITETGSENVVFVGVIDTISVRQYHDVYYLELEAVSYSYNLDITKKYRSFQDLSMTYRDILDEVLADYDKTHYIDTVTNKQIIPDIIVQYNETDWEFIKRLASHFNASVVADCKESFPRFYFGLPKWRPENNIDNIPYTREKNIEDYIHTVSNFNSSINSWDKISCEFESYSYFELAERLKFKLEPLVVTKTTGYVRNEEIVYKYHLTTANGVGQNFQENKNIVGAKLEGVIKEVKRNTIRIHLNIDKVYRGKDNKFIPYAGGINNEVGYYMPKPGSSVQMYFPNGNEGDSIISASVRKGTAGHERMSDHREKHLRNQFGKELRLGVNDMEFITGNDEIKINMTADGKMLINAPEAITINTNTNLIAGNYDEFETYVSWVTIPGGITENIRFEAENNLILRTGESEGAFVLSDENSDIVQRSYDKILMNGYLKKPPIQDYSAEIAAAQAEDEAMLEMQRDMLVQQEEAAKAEARKNILNGLKNIAVGALCIGLAVSTGGAAVPLIAACVAGGTAVVTGASTAWEGVSSAEKISRGDYSGGFNPMREGLQYALGDEAGAMMYDVLFYGSAFVSELFIGSMLPVQFSGISKLDKIYKAQKTGAIISVANQGLSDIMTGEFSGISSYIQAAEKGTFNALVNGVLPQPPCGSNISKWAWQQTTGFGMNVMNQALDTGSVNLDERFWASTATGAAFSFGGVYTDNPIAKYALDVAGDTAGAVGYDASQLYQNWDSMTEKERKDAAWSIAKNGAQTFGSSLMTNAIQQILEVEPVDTVRGHLDETFTDLVISSLGFNLEIIRKYNSKNHAKGVVGRGFSINVDTRIVRDDICALVILPDSSVEMFVKWDEGWTSIKEGSRRYKLEENYITGEMRLLTPGRLTYEYNKSGHLKSIEDANLNKLTVSYIEGTDLISEITKTDGQKLLFTYADNKIAKIEDTIGRTVEYKYSGELLTEVRGINNGVTKYNYSDDGYMESIIDAKGVKYVENRFDRKGRVIWQRFSQAEEVEISYDDKNRKNTFYFKNTDSYTTYHYDSRLLVTSIDYNDGTTEEYEYDQWENTALTKDRNGNVTTQEYDIDGNLLVRTYPDGSTEKYKYNESGFLTYETRPNGQHIMREYDSRGNLTEQREETRPSDYAVTSYVYDARGRAISKTDPNKNIFVYSFKDDNAVFPVEVKNPDGVTVRFEYDEVNRKISESINGITTEYTYTNKDSISKITDPLGNVTQMHYNSIGKLLMKITPNEAAKGSLGTYYKYEYDSFDRLKRTTDPEGNVTAMILDNWGRLLKEINPNTYDPETEDGEGVRHEYDPEGNRIKTIFPGGGVMRFKYDSEGDKVKEIIPQNYDKETDDGPGTTYSYDSRNRLTLVTGPDGNVVKKYLYNETGKIIKEIDAKGYLSGDNDEERYGTAYRYNAAGWLTVKYEPKTVDPKTGQALYCVTRYEYDKNGNVVEEMKSGDYVGLREYPDSFNTIRYAYDPMNRLKVVSDSTGAEMSYEYDSRGNRILERLKINESKYQITRYTYDEANRLIQKSEYINKVDAYEPDNEGSNTKAITQYFHDANGNVIKIITPEGYKIIREYDRLDRVLKEIRVEGKQERITAAEYDKAGNIVKTTDVNGNSETKEYDLMNRPVRVINREGGVTRRFYTDTGKVRKEILPEQYDHEADDGDGTEYFYDVKDREIKKVNAAGVTVNESTYDENGNVISVKDAMGLTTNYSFDIGNRTIAITTPESAARGTVSQRNSYSALDSLTETIDGEGNKTAYLLDKWGRIIKVSKANGSTEQYNYDCAGNITATTDGNGNTIKYVYNSINKLGKIVDQEKLEEIFKYDRQGRLAYKKDRNGVEVKYSYNIDDHITSRSNAADPMDDGSRETYKYNLDGTMKEASANGIVYTYVYDAMGRQLEKYDSGKLLLKYTYDLNGNVIGQKDISGKKTEYRLDKLGRIEEVYDDGKFVTEYFYNADNTISVLAHGNGVSTAYEYDGNKNITRLTTLFKDGSVLTQNSYVYDNNGNQIQKTENGVATLYGYDSISQITKVIYNKETNNEKQEEFTYDAAGNRIKRTVDGIKEVYYYDGKNRLTKLQGSSNGNVNYVYDNQGNTIQEQSQSGTTEYAYDIYNRAVEVKTKDGHVQCNHYDAIGLRAGTEQDGEVSRYIFRGWSVVGELDGENRLKAREVRGYGLLEKDVGNEAYYYHHNEHGDITALTDADSIEANRYEYDVFGNEMNEKERIGNHFRYAGEQFDLYTGQYYLRARFYNPTVGRFTQEDVYWRDGSNLYVYVASNPIMWVDPSGCVKGKEKYTSLDDFIDSNNTQAGTNYFGEPVLAPSGQQLGSGDIARGQTWSTAPIY